MAKIKNSVWAIFFESVKLYFTNFGSFFKYLAFPVFGQVAGIILTFFATFLYTQSLPKLISGGGVFNNFSMIFLVLLLITLPGLFIFIKAFWDYLVAYGAINSMTENMIKSGKVYDFAAHTELITRKTPSFVGLWLLFGLFVMIGYFPLFWVVAFILFVYFVLIFQVFTFEPDKTPVACFQKSMQIIKGNFARTLGLMILLFLFTYCFLPEIVKFLFDFVTLISLFAIPLDVWVNQFPINDVNKALMTLPFAIQISSLFIAKAIVSSFIGYCVICFTLPIRSIAWSLWYKNLNKGEVKLDKKILDRAEGKE